MFSFLEVFQSPLTKKRIGRNVDGGYVIAWDDSLHYDLYLSGGISDDISFEEDFIKKYEESKNGTEKVEFYAFDGTVNGLPHPNPKIHFVKKLIGDKNNNRFSDMRYLMNDKSNIFLKMDIEGGEYPWFSCLSEQEMKKFRQITIELHHPYNINVLEKLKKTHELIHLHGNNCSFFSVYNYKGNLQKLPNAIECTYIRRDEYTFIPSVEDIPGPLDFPNHPAREDFVLRGAPFNNLSYNVPLHKQMLQPNIRYRTPLKNKPNQQINNLRRKKLQQLKQQQLKKLLQMKKRF